MLILTNCWLGRGEKSLLLVVTRHHLPSVVMLPFPSLTLAVVSEKMKSTSGTSINTGIKESNLLSKHFNTTSDLSKFFPSPCNSQSHF